MRRLNVHGCLILALVLIPGIGRAQSVEAVLEVVPAVEPYVAATATFSGPHAVSGVRFFNNDQLSVFPRVILMEGEPGQPPDLANTALVLAEVGGASLQWDQLDLPLPVSSSTGIMHFVFELPPTPVQGAGSGGGAALGVGASGLGLPFYVSANGNDWVAFSDVHDVAVEPIMASAKSANAISLNELRESFTGASTEVPVPIKETKLLAPYPNPFNPRSTLRFQLHAAGHVQLRVYDLRGRMVRNLLDEMWPRGRHQVTWDGTDSRGHQIGNGVYFLRLTTEGAQDTKRLLLLK